MRLRHRLRAHANGEARGRAPSGVVERAAPAHGGDALKSHVEGTYGRRAKRRQFIRNLRRVGGSFVAEHVSEQGLRLDVVMDEYCDA